MNKKIVILGAGFGGVKTALQLSKKLKQGVDIILVDKHTYQTYVPALYEVATAYRGSDLSQERIQEQKFKGDVSSVVAFDLRTVFQNTQVQLVCDEVVKVDVKQQVVYLKKDGDLEYDYCVFALGSQVGYFNVAGAQQHTLSLKTLHNALEVRDTIQQAVQTKDSVCIVVVGAGLAGFEVCTEIACYVKHLTKKQSKHINIVLVEGQDKVLCSCSDAMCQKASKRLEDLNIRVRTQERITQVQKNKVIFSDNSSLDTDAVVWSGGTDCSYLEGLAPDVSLFSKKGQFLVANPLHLYEHANAFALGDCAFFEGVPETAYIAEQQADVVAQNIVNALNNKKMIEYKPKQVGFISSAGGKYAIADIGFCTSGMFAWVIKRVVDLKYIFSIYPLASALKMWYSGIKIFSKND